MDEMDAPMRTMCPACNCWVDSFGAGDDSIIVDGVAHHSKCAPKPEPKIIHGYTRKQEAASPR